MTTGRVTQTSARVVSNATANARITQDSIRVVSSAINHARITQDSIRVVSTNTPDPVGNQANFLTFF